MLVMVESNEGTDREKNREDRELRVDSSNLRAVQRLKQFFPGLQECPLVCGDINVVLDNGQLLAIERKRAGDFLGSIASKRIFRQVENMAQNAAWSCVVIEGLISFDKNDMTMISSFDKNDNINGYLETDWRGVSVRGAMYAIQWSGCPIMTIQPHALPNMIADLARFCSKPAEHAQSLGRKRYITFPPIELKEEIVAAFPSVGPKRARSLFEFSKKQNDKETGTLAEALSWGSALNLIDRKSRPEGWGDKTIEGFRTTLGLETGEYLMVQEDKQIKSQHKKGNKNGKT